MLHFYLFVGFFRFYSLNLNKMWVCEIFIIKLSEWMCIRVDRKNRVQLYASKSKFNMFYVNHKILFVYIFYYLWARKILNNFPRVMIFLKKLGHFRSVDKTVVSQNFKIFWNIFPIICIFLELDSNMYYLKVCNF